MTYNAEMSRANPTCSLLLIDQSGLMDESFVGDLSKSNQRILTRRPTPFRPWGTVSPNCSRYKVLKGFSFGPTASSFSRQGRTSCHQRS